MLPKISVIVPVYKVEAYLRECIDSIINQTYENLEIILVDDGSPDNCGKICDEYAERDNRITVIHKKNGGLSDARNAGIDIATGDYIGFVDSDDWIEANMYETLYNNLISNNADISTCGYYYSYKDLNVDKTGKYQILVFDTEKAIEFSLATSAQGGLICCNKIFKKYIFNNIRFPYKKINEDIFTIVRTLLEAHLVVVDTSPKYYYRQRKSSIMNGNYDSKIMDYIEASEYNLKVVQNKYPDITDCAKARLLIGYFMVLGRIIVCDGFKKIPEYKNVVSTIKNNFQFIMKCKYFSQNDKIKAIAVKINVWIYKFIIILNDKKNRINRIKFE